MRTTMALTAIEQVEAFYQAIPIEYRKQGSIKLTPDLYRLFLKEWKEKYQTDIVPETYKGVNICPVNPLLEFFYQESPNHYYHG